MDYCNIKSKDNQQYGNCLYLLKKYEEELFKNGKVKYPNIIMDDKHSKVIVKDDEVEFKFTDDLYLALLDDLVEYRKTLRDSDNV